MIIKILKATFEKGFYHSWKDFVDNFVQNIIITLMFRGAAEEHLKKGFQFYMKASDYIMFGKQSCKVIW